MRGVNSSGARNAKALAKSLSDVLGAPGRGRKGGQPASRRVDVVSDGLCGDVVKYLAPTLEQHKGCTLIDIHPGAGFFTSKLHEFIKPKAHILIEPEGKYFDQFLKPLLDQPGSTYRHTAPVGVSVDAQWSNIRKMYKDPSLLPGQPLLSLSDSGRRKLDPSVLVIGNLARYRGSGFEKTVPIAPLMLHQLAHDVLGDDFLPTNGFVRMLWWLPESYKATILPRHHPHKRSSFNVGLDLAFNISEVTGVTPIQALMDGRTKYHSPRKRLGVLDDSNRETVSKGMEKLGLVAPEGRLLQKIERQSLESSSTVENVSPLTRPEASATVLQARIDSLLSRIAQLTPWITDHKLKYVLHQELIHAALETLEYPQCNATHEQVHAKKHSSRERVALLLDLDLRLLNVEALFKDLEDRTQSKASLEHFRNKILSIDEELYQMTTQTSHKTSQLLEDLLEDQLAFYSQSPLMTWDRRSYEPLQAKTSDFWPKFDMTLLDFMPKQVDLSVPDLADSRECSRFCAEMLKVLFSAKNLPLPSALERIGLNAGKDLIPIIPAITDVRRGGRLNPNRLRVRMVTTEMVEGLVKAFFEWPFRPEKWELTLANEAAQDFGDTMEDTVEKAAG